LSVNLITIQLQSKFIYQNAWFSVFASSHFVLTNKWVNNLFQTQFY